MLPLLSCCLRLEGIHYIPGYRQLSKAIFQLCAFKELIGGEIILSRWRHNFSHLPRGLPVLKGGLGSRGSAPAPTPVQGCTWGDAAPVRPMPVWGSHQQHMGGSPHCSAPGLGLPLLCPCPGSFAPHFPPRIPAAPALPSSCTKPGAADLHGAAPRAKFI